MAVYVEGCCGDYIADDDFEDFQCENDLCGGWHSEIDRYDEDDIESIVEFIKRNVVGGYNKKTDGFIATNEFYILDLKMMNDYKEFTEEQKEKLCELFKISQNELIYILENGETEKNEVYIEIY